MLRTLLVAAALTQQSDAAGDHGGVKEKCSCAQAEPDHPFTIDCDDTATIRAATTTLESTCKVNNAGYEWGGAFPTPDNAYKWVAQAKDGAYADPSMKLVVFDVHAADKEHLLELAETAKTLIAGTCTVVNTQGTIPAPTEAGACYTLTFPTDPATDFHATVTTTGVANVAFFGEHGPTEFERDTHYLMKDGMTAAAMASATSAGSGGPVEPGAETDAEEFNCRLLKDGQVKTCAQAFLVIQAHHDYCPHDTLTRYEEELFHQWESKCHGCSIVRMYNANLKNCPVVDCTDDTVAQFGYDELKDSCTAADTSFAFEWAGSFPTPADSYKWVAQAATKANETDVFPAGHSYADPEMKMVVYAMTSTLKSELFGKKDDADELMSSGPCTVVNTQGTIPAPTEAGACYTLTFPTDPATDFHATVTTTGVANVAFFTAHMPTEFERDTHYLMKDGMTAAAMASATSAGSGGPVEPGAETDAEEFNCRLLKDGQVKTCAQAFLVIQAHHDYCPHDTLTRYEEELFHQWESKCHGCSIVRMYNANLKNCPVVDCTDDTVAQFGYDELKDSCTAADTSFAFEWAGSFPTPADSYKWVAQAATKANETDVFPAGHSYADPEMKMVVYAMTSTLKSELFGKKDDADELMSSGPCTVVNTQGTIPAPTEAGACYTLTFPTDPATDFHATVTTTGVANVAFFTAHMPTEFERDTHYLMKDDMTAAAMASATSAGSDGPVEPDNQLGESGGHDHGRRLSAVGRNDRRSRRRLANPGSCCNTARQQGAWKQVVSYHDQCDHSQVPEYIEVGFHDYEASCEEFFCNLIGPDEDQTVCPYAPPSPPPLPSLPPSPSSPVVTESTGIEEGTLIGVIVAAVVVALILLAGVACLVAKEKAGKPLFTSLDAPASKA